MTKPPGSLDRYSKEIRLIVKYADANSSHLKFIEDHRVKELLEAISVVKEALKAHPGHQEVS